MSSLQEINAIEEFLLAIDPVIVPAIVSSIDPFDDVPFDEVPQEWVLYSPLGVFSDSEDSEAAETVPQQAREAAIQGEVAFDVESPFVRINMLVRIRAYLQKTNEEGVDQQFTTDDEQEGIERCCCCTVNKAKQQLLPCLHVPFCYGCGVIYMENFLKDRSDPLSEEINFRCPFCRADILQIVESHK